MYDWSFKNIYLSCHQVYKVRFLLAILPILAQSSFYSFSAKLNSEYYLQLENLIYSKQMNKYGMSHI